ncbi:MAG: DUF1844 domain-containing protein [Trueperaceae bacterium]
MADPRFIGLVHSVLASAQASLGEEHSPMGRHLDRAGVRSRRTAERSLALLAMLHEKTRGNLDETERASLDGALRTIRGGLDAITAHEAGDEDAGDADADRTALPMHDADGPN